MFVVPFASHFLSKIFDFIALLKESLSGKKSDALQVDEEEDCRKPGCVWFTFLVLSTTALPSAGKDMTASFGMKESKVTTRGKSDNRLEGSSGKSSRADSGTGYLPFSHSRATKPSFLDFRPPTLSPQSKTHSQGARQVSPVEPVSAASAPSAESVPTPVATSTIVPPVRPVPPLSGAGKVASTTTPTGPTVPSPTTPLSGAGKVASTTTPTGPTVPSPTTPLSGAGKVASTTTPTGPTVPSPTTPLSGAGKVASTTTPTGPTVPPSTTPLSGAGKVASTTTPTGPTVPSPTTPLSGAGKVASTTTPTGPTVPSPTTPLSGAGKVASTTTSTGPTVPSPTTPLSGAGKVASTTTSTGPTVPPSTTPLSGAGKVASTTTPTGPTVPSPTTPLSGAGKVASTTTPTGPTVPSPTTPLSGAGKVASTTTPTGPTVPSPTTPLSGAGKVASTTTPTGPTVPSPTTPLSGAGKVASTTTPTGPTVPSPTTPLSGAGKVASTTTPTGPTVPSPTTPLSGAGKVASTTTPTGPTVPSPTTPLSGAGKVASTTTPTGPTVPSPTTPLSGAGKVASTTTPTGPTVPSPTTPLSGAGKVASTTTPTGPTVPSPTTPLSGAGKVASTTTPTGPTVPSPTTPLSGAGKVASTTTPTGPTVPSPTTPLSGAGKVASTTTPTGPTVPSPTTPLSGAGKVASTTTPTGSGAYIVSADPLSITKVPKEGVIPGADPLVEQGPTLTTDIEQSSSTVLKKLRLNHLFDGVGKQTAPAKPIKSKAEKTPLLHQLMNQAKQLVFGLKGITSVLEKVPDETEVSTLSAPAAKVAVTTDTRQVLTAEAVHIDEPIPSILKRADMRGQHLQGVGKQAVPFTEQEKQRVSAKPIETRTPAEKAEKIVAIPEPLKGEVHQMSFIEQLIMQAKELVLGLKGISSVLEKLSDEPTLGKPAPKEGVMPDADQFLTAKAVFSQSDLIDELYEEYIESQMPYMPIIKGALKNLQQTRSKLLESTILPIDDDHEFYLGLVAIPPVTLPTLDVHLASLEISFSTSSTVTPAITTTAIPIVTPTAAPIAFDIATVDIALLKQAMVKATQSPQDEYDNYPEKRVRTIARTIPDLEAHFASLGAIPSPTASTISASTSTATTAASSTSATATPVVKPTATTVIFDIAKVDIALLKQAMVKATGSPQDEYDNYPEKRVRTIARTIPDLEAHFASLGAIPSPTASATSASTSTATTAAFDFDTIDIDDLKRAMALADGFDANMYNDMDDAEARSLAHGMTGLETHLASLGAIPSPTASATSASTSTATTAASSTSATATPVVKPTATTVIFDIAKVDIALLKQAMVKATGSPQDEYDNYPEKRVRTIARTIPHLEAHFASLGAIPSPTASITAASTSTATTAAFDIDTVDIDDLKRAMALADGFDTSMYNDMGDAEARSLARSMTGLEAHLASLSAMPATVDLVSPPLSPRASKTQTAPPNPSSSELKNLVSKFMDALNAYYEQSSAIKKSAIAQAKLQKAHLKMMKGGEKRVLDNLKKFSQLNIVKRMVKKGLGTDDLSTLSNTDLLENATYFLEQKADAIKSTKEKHAQNTLKHLMDKGMSIDEMMPDNAFAIQLKVDMEVENFLRDATPEQKKDFENYQNLLSTASSNKEIMKIFQAAEKQFGESITQRLYQQLGEQNGEKGEMETLKGHILQDKHQKNFFVYDRAENMNVLIGKPTTEKGIWMLPVSDKAMEALKKEGIKYGERVRVTTTLDNMLGDEVIAVEKTQDIEKSIKEKRNPDIQGVYVVHSSGQKFVVYNTDENPGILAGNSFGKNSKMRILKIDQALLAGKTLNPGDRMTASITLDPSESKNGVVRSVAPTGKGVSATIEDFPVEFLEQLKEEAIALLHTFKSRATAVIQAQFKKLENGYRLALKWGNKQRARTLRTQAEKNPELGLNVATYLLNYYLFDEAQQLPNEKERKAFLQKAYEKEYLLETTSPDMANIILHTVEDVLSKEDGKNLWNKYERLLFASKSVEEIMGELNPDEPISLPKLKVDASGELVEDTSDRPEFDDTALASSVASEDMGKSAQELEAELDVEVAALSSVPKTFRVSKVETKQDKKKKLKKSLTVRSKKDENT